MPATGFPISSTAVSQMTGLVRRVGNGLAFARLLTFFRPANGCRPSNIVEKGMDDRDDQQAVDIISPPMTARAIGA
jgi:hypothetical protein